MKPFIESGALVMLGVIQEQHAERCRLFQQWQVLDFPIVQDLLNTNGIAVVPVYVAVDENGIVRDLPRSPGNFADDFINKSFASGEVPAPVVDSVTATSAWWQTRADQNGSISNLMGWADCLIKWDPTETNVQSAIEHYSAALKITPERSDIQFRLGAANRLLYELKNQADPVLFGDSVRHWESALNLNPNQYIYRRRIEQYGPRLSKPYSFYDWVSTARKEISSRGETPLKLMVEPDGAELADRARAMAIDTSGENPDPESLIAGVEEGWVISHATFVPTRPGPGDVVAVHIGLNVVGNAKWNHESTPLMVWLDQPADEVLISSKLIIDETPHSNEESTDPVSLTFEIQITTNHSGNIQLTGFSLFSICDSATGQCLHRRHDVIIDIPVSQ